MSRKLAAACVVALALSPVAHAADREFFVNGALGTSQARLGSPYGSDYHRDGSDITTGLRFGALWRGQPWLGVETGFVDLGRFSERYAVGSVDVRDEARTRAALLGVNTTYRFDAPWYLSARGGWLHSWVKVSARESQAGSTSYVTATASATASGDGWYMGVGGGYDVSEQFSVGAHLDFYRVQVSRNGADLGGHVGTLTVQLEYRY